MNSESNEIKILSIDGGGIRGIIPAYFLSVIESKLKGRKIYEYFDIIAGTSTGGIIALAIASGIATKDIYRLYENKGKLIFKKRNIFSKIKNKSFYDSKILEKELEKIFNDKTMGDLKTKVIIPSSIINNKETKVFKTPHEVNHPQKEMFSVDAKYKLKDVALATSSAPFYFQPKKIENCYFWDGGLWANNPATCVILEARRIDKNARIKMLSFGTGYSSSLISYNKINKISFLFNKKSLINYLLDIQSSYISNQTRFLLNFEELKFYKRINPDLGMNIELDNSSKIEDLKVIAQKITEKEENEVINKYFK